METVVETAVAVASVAGAVEAVTDQAVDAEVPLRMNGSPRPNLAVSSRVITSNLSRRSTLTLFPSKKMKLLRSSLPKTKLSSPMRL